MPNVAPFLLARLAVRKVQVAKGSCHPSVAGDAGAGCDVGGVGGGAGALGGLGAGFSACCTLVSDDVISAIVRGFVESAAGSLTTKWLTLILLSVRLNSQPLYAL